jgi:small-conductance mechanosensitive channel
MKNLMKDIMKNIKYILMIAFALLICVPAFIKFAWWVFGAMLFGYGVTGLIKNNYNKNKK